MSKTARDDKWYIYVKCRRGKKLTAPDIKNVLVVIDQSENNRQR